jgi:hypothetical protein
MRDRPEPQALSQLPWWTSPAGITLGFLLPMLLLIAYAGAANIPGLTVRGVPFLGTQYLVLGAAELLVIAITGWMGSQIVAKRRAPADPDAYSWDRAAFSVGVIALLAYLIFFKDFLASPSLLFHTLTGAYRPDRNTLELTVGVTSLENFGPVFFSIYAYRVIYQRMRMRRIIHLLCLALLGLTAFRVYAWSERLALIEAVVPFGLAAAGWLSRTPGTLPRLVTRGGPFVAMPALILYFGAAEYVRSWQSATYHGRSGFWEFTIGRLASYYYTSLNNGAGLLATGNWPRFQFEYTLSWLHRAPLIGHKFSSYVDFYGDSTTPFLKKFGDLEFNNPSGLFSVVYDLGLPLATVYFALLGLAAGMLFRAFRTNSFAGALWYPLLFLTLLEIFRYPYMGASRGFTWALGIGFAALVGRRWFAPRTTVYTPEPLLGRTA